MSSIIRARNGDMVVSFRWWSAEQSPARRHQQNTPIRHHPDFTTPALGDSRSVQPVFLPQSHGFRSGRSCHTALEEIRNTWTGTKWLIEVDVRGFLDAVS